jgi:hypothetical protein
MDHTEGKALTVEYFTSLDRETRTVSLVGYFLQFWSVLESNLNHAIEHALDLKMVQGAIVTKNIQLRDKIHMLKTLVDVRGMHVERLKKVLDDVATLSGDRNMIAHDMFMADDEGDGVQFIVVKAKGKLSFPETRWSIVHFLKKYGQITDLTEKVKEVDIVVSQITLARLLAEAKDPSAWPQGLGLLNPLLHPLPELPGSPPQASGETEPETHSGSGPK